MQSVIVAPVSHGFEQLTRLTLERFRHAGFHRCRIFELLPQALRDRIGICNGQCISIVDHAFDRDCHAHS